MNLINRLRAVPITAVGAVAAQFSQAGASFLLSLTGLRVLSPEDFGRLALVVGSLIFITAVVTGFIGDSLTILDRADSRIRGALEVWSLILGAAIFVGATSISWATGFLSARDALLFGAALVAFTFEDTARRLLMAQLRFWSVVTVDLAYLITAGVALGLFYAAQGSLELGDFLIALIVGQTLAVAVAYVLADRDDRWATSMRGAALREVAEFGGWRAAQQSIRPGATLAVRIQIAVIAGQIAVGQLEAARVYVSPALLMVQGLTSFLLATNVRQLDHDPEARLAAAKRASIAMTALTAVMGLVAVLIFPLAWPLITGNPTDGALLPVAGWAICAVPLAFGSPYASLGAIHARQWLLVRVRLFEAVLSVAFVALLVGAGVTPMATPLALAASAVVGSLLIRRVAMAAVRGRGSRLPQSPPAATDQPTA